MPPPVDHAARMARTRASLEGLSVGDAFGQTFFTENSTDNWARRIPMPAPWYYTDDTQMALSIYAVLDAVGEIDQDMLAKSFAAYYDPGRGYGPAMHGQLRAFRAGSPWQEVSRGLFDGLGSFGNGAAMRIAPLGAYFADDPALAATQAFLSAEVTHAHPEGIAGAMATAVAAAFAASYAGKTPPTRQEFIAAILPYVPDSAVCDYLTDARDMNPGDSVHLAARRLGNGSQITAQDTVPFCIWCAGEYLADYEKALWQTTRAYGDIDTNCAIVGGIVAAYTGRESIPVEWIAARELLPKWIGQPRV